MKRKKIRHHFHRLIHSPARLIRYGGKFVLFLILSLGILPMAACSIAPNSRIFKQMLNGLPAAAYDISSGLVPERSYRHVLLLNSYHPGYDWTDEVTDGVQSALNLVDSDIDLHTEYMDTKSVADPDYIEYLFYLYQKKFSSSRFDVLVAVDDDAFQFLLKYRGQLFPDTPLVFCGVSDFDLHMIEGQDDITGLLEKNEHLKTLNLALGLHPAAQQVVIITDSTTTGKIHQVHIEEQVKNLDRQVEVVFLSELPMETLEERLSEIPEDSIVYLTGFNRDEAGIVFSSEEALYHVIQATRAPIYSYKYAYLGNGLVGGYITWGYTHGKAAADIAMQVMSGTPAASIPVSSGNIDPPMFDYRQLQNFDIDIADLPQNSVVAYGPDPIVSRNNAIIFGLLIFMAGETILIVIMIWNHRMRRRAEKDLRESEERYRQLVENFPGGMVMLFDQEQQCRMLGGSSLQEFGLTNENSEGRPLCELFPEETCDAFEPHFQLALQGTASLFEISQHVHFYEVRTIPLRDARGSIHAGMAVIQNITQRKQSELELQVLTHELEQNEERLNLAIMGADLGLWDWDVQSGGMVYNRRWAEMLGYELEEIEPHIGFWEQIVHPDDMPRIMHAFAEHFVGKTASYDNEMRMRAKSGGWKWVQARGKVVRRDDNGLPLRATGTHIDITERKQVEEALRESIQRLDLAIMGADLGLWDWNLETDEMVFSHAWIKMMGFSQEEIGTSKQSWVQLIHPEDREALLANADAHIQGEAPVFEAEYRMRNKNGEWKWFLSRGRIVEFSPDGTPLHMSGTLLDVTGRKVAMEDRRQVEERLEMALNATSLGLWDIDIKTGCGICDQRFIEMLGFSLENINFKDGEWKHLVHPDDLPEVMQVVEKVLSGSEPYLEVQERLRTKSGSWKWVQTRASVVERDENNQPLRMAGTHLDITRAKRSEEALRSRMLALTEPYGNVSNFKFEDVFDIGEIQAIQDAFALATGVASIISDLEGNPITRGSNSRKACRLIESTAAGQENCRETSRFLTGANAKMLNTVFCYGAGFLNSSAPIWLGDDCIAYWIIGEVLPDEFDENELMAYARRIGIDEEQFKLALQEMPRMSKKQFEQIGAALSLIAGQLSRLALQNILQARDITRRNRNEAALRKSENRVRQLNEDLEMRVNERTAALQAANRELESFTDTISHDLRTPLSSIESYSRVLNEEYFSMMTDEARRYLNLVQENTRQMGQIIDNLLLFSRLNHQQLERQPLDLSQVADQVYRDLQGGLNDRSVTFRLAELPVCSADIEMMRQVLTNLLSNAIKFTARRKEGIIEMGYEQQNGKTIFFIKDNGVGFDNANSEKLFDVFHRLHSNNEFPGMGIGLAITRRIIHRHGGKIWAQSEEGKGATFYFSLECEE